VKVPLHDGEADLETGEVRLGDAVRTLTPTERELLAALVAHPNEVVTYRQLLRDVWRAHPRVQTRAVEATVARLRKKLGEDGKDPLHIRTVRGEGLRWTPAMKVPRVQLLGRDAEIDRLVEGLATSRVVTIAGLPGSGRTRLARAVAPRAPLVALSNASDLWEAVGVAVGATEPHRRLSVVAALASHDTVVLELPDDLSEASRVAAATAIEALSREAALVLTSARLVGVPGEFLLRLGPLSPPHTRLLLERRVTELGGGTSSADLDKVAASLDGYPLEVEVVAGALVLLGTAGVETLGALDLAPASPLQGTLRSALARIWDMLPDAERTLLQALTPFRAMVDLQAMAEVTETPLYDVYCHAQQAVARGWLQLVTPGWFRLPGLVRTFVRDRDLAAAKHAGDRWRRSLLALEEDQLRSSERARRYLPDLVAATENAQADDVEPLGLALAHQMLAAGPASQIRDALTQLHGRCPDPHRDLVLGLLLFVLQHADLPGWAEDLDDLSREARRRVDGGSREPWLLRAALGGGRAKETIVRMATEALTEADGAHRGSRQRLWVLLGTYVAPEFGLPRLNAQRQEAERHGWVAFVQMLQPVIAQLLLVEGRVAEAAEHAGGSGSIAVRGMPDLIRVPSLLLSGQTDAVDELLGRLARGRDTTDRVVGLCLLTRAVIAHGLGHADHAGELATSVGHQPTWIQLFQLQPLLTWTEGTELSFDDPYLNDCLQDFLDGKPRIESVRPLSSSLLLWWLCQRGRGFPSDGVSLTQVRDAARYALT